MFYSRITLSTLVALQPEALPAALVGLDNATLADLPAALDPVPAEFDGVGYWPAAIVYLPIDGRLQTVGDGFDIVADGARKTITATARIRDLTPDEIAALPPVPMPDPYAHFIPAALFRQRAEKMGIWEDLATFLAQSPPLWMKVLTLERGLDPEFPDLIAGFDQMNIPQPVRAFLLAHPSEGVPDIPEGGFGD
ncbi:hypothetical protein [Aureimonas pseudogalii]|uniref:Uncharacterized protein n=1 Tax=Aureimonas pseudogalii TaxID=1744844 RepID=A0A7W6H372_9HYPH|nr:hypothetical protein [Aureimonas pseudogalii]MBB3996872.1 hypothetical protein [Aureimonas pseudogalii]